MDGINRQNCGPKRHRYKARKNVHHCVRCGKIIRAGMRVIAQGRLCFHCNRSDEETQLLKAV